jgi:hypothetical protein
LLMLAGCTAGPLTATGPASPSVSQTRAPTRTEAPPPTVTPTATEIPTVVPVVTPSPGPKPELELVNVTIVNDMPWAFIFMGEIKNNTDEPMIFNEREFGLHLTFERWWEWANVYHGLMEVNLRPLNSMFQVMNCIIYPGETGVVAFNTRAVCPNNTYCPRTEEIITEPLHQEGTRLIGYEAFYRRWADLKRQYPFDREYNGYPEELYEGYHPAVENISYRMEGERIVLEFDVDIIFPAYGHHDTASWMILYDAEGKIINILFADPIYCEGVGCFISRTYHLFGIGSNLYIDRRPTVAPDVFTDWWKPIMELTEEQLQLVDHIRVLNELQNFSMCSNPLSP